MNNQRNVVSANQVTASKRPAQKKRVGCLGCFGYALLTVLVLSVGFFVFNAIRNKIDEKEQQKLKARFDYEQKLSAEDKLTRAFKNGEISADTYILQLAYSLYDVEKLDPLYKSDNDVDFAPDILGMAVNYIDELSDDTLEYIAKKVMLTDIKIHPDASQNSGAYENKRKPFYKYVYAEGYDVTVLDKAILSSGGKFLIWYTETGKSAVSSETVQQLAGTMEKIADDISDFLNIEWNYKFNEINSDSYNHMKKVLDECGIDESAMKKALPAYIYEPSDTVEALAWYHGDITFWKEMLKKMLKGLGEKDLVKEFGSVYSLPYIVIRTSFTDDIDNMNLLFAHELTHHFQNIYYNDPSYNAPGFTKETVAEFVAASIIDIKGTNTVVNMQANEYIKVTDNYYANMINGKPKGYVEFVWAKSYADIVDNGIQYLKESLLKKILLNFFGRKLAIHTNWYLKILQYAILLRTIRKKVLFQQIIQNLQRSLAAI